MVIDEGRFPGRQGRLLFAYLVAEQGRAVPRDELAEALWGDAPPATWDKALTVLVSKLRAVLSDGGIDGTGALTGAFGCYRLELPAGSWVDIVEAARAADEAETALAAGGPEQAKTAAALAETLVRQPFLPGDDGAWVEEKRRQIADVRVRALSVLAETSLSSGDAREAVKWSAEIVGLEPFRESGYRQLMQAHVAAGNRAEALRVYERCRRLLADELGTYPSPETEAIYRGLLEQAPPGVVDMPTSGDEHERDLAAAGATQRRKWVWVVAALAVAAAGVAGIFATKGGGSHTTVPENSIVGLDSSGSIADTVPVGARPVAITSGAGSLWVANLDDRSVTRVDASSGRAVRTISVGKTPTALAGTRTAVWVADATGDVSSIDPSYDRLSSRLHLATLGPGCCLYAASTPTPTLAAFGSIWVTDPNGYVSRVNPRSGRRTALVDVGNDPTGITAGAGSVWVTNGTDGTVTRIDPATLLTTPIPVGHGPAAVAVNAAGAWVADAGEDKVVHVDVGTNAVTGTTHVGAGPTAIVAMPTGLWVANGGDGTVMRLDPRSGKVTRTIHLGGTPDALATAAGKLWVAVAPAPPRPPAAGGVAHLTSQFDIQALDPALAIQPGIPYATCANLVAYPDKPAPEGSRIVPEVAEAVPTPTAGGRTYTFTIRPGFRFSPPSSEPVTAATFKATIERVANPRLKSPFASEFSGVAGYDALRERQGARARGHRCPRSHPDDQAVAAGRRLPHQPRDRRGVRGAARHPGRPRRTRRRPVCGALLRRLVHASPAAHPQTESELPRRAPPPSGRDRGRDRSRQLARTRRGRGGHSRLRPRRPAARSGAETGVEVRPRQQGCEGGTPAVLRQPRARRAMAAHEHEQAAVLPDQDAARGELRDRPGRLSSPRDDGSPR